MNAKEKQTKVDIQALPPLEQELVKRHREALEINRRNRFMVFRIGRHRRGPRER